MRRHYFNVVLASFLLTVLMPEYVRAEKTLHIQLYKHQGCTPTFGHSKVLPSYGHVGIKLTFQHFADSDDAWREFHKCHLELTQKQKSCELATQPSEHVLQELKQTCVTQYQAEISLCRSHYEREEKKCDLLVPKTERKADDRDKMEAAASRKPKHDASKEPQWEELEPSNAIAPGWEELEPSNAIAPGWEELEPSNAIAPGWEELEPSNAIAPGWEELEPSNAIAPGWEELEPSNAIAPGWEELEPSNAIAPGWEELEPSNAIAPGWEELNSEDEYETQETRVSVGGGAKGKPNGSGLINGLLSQHQLAAKGNRQQKIQDHQRILQNTLPMAQAAVQQGNAILLQSWQNLTNKVQSQSSDERCQKIADQIAESMGSRFSSQSGSIDRCDAGREQLRILTYAKDNLSRHGCYSGEYDSVISKTQNYVTQVC